MLKVRTLFSGIGSPEVALRDLKIPFELVDFCEVDKYAVQSYCAVHGVDPSKNLGDITKVWGRNLPYADLLVWGFPCTDISVAGKQAGIVEGSTRSGLYYEGLRILRETKPKYSIIENVKNLTCKKFKAEFEQMLADIKELGYNNYWKVLNAKDYGIPQNRERVFIVSIRADVDKGYEFPVGFDNGLRLKDFLEDEVDEKYYISQEKTEKLISQLNDKKIDDLCINTKMQKLQTRDDGLCCTLTSSMYKEPPQIINVGNVNPSGKGMNGNVFAGDICPTLTTNKGEGPKMCVPCITPDRVEKRQNGRRFKEDGDPSFTLTSQDRHGVLVKEATKQGYSIATPGDSINIQFPNSDTRRGRVGHGVAQTLETSCNQAVLVKDKPILVGGVGEINFGSQYRQGNRIYDSEAVAMCLLAQPVGNAGGNSYLYQVDYRIRKLTPKECWRLMGFTDEDFQKAVDAGVSNSQLYKQAGNSIVSTVLAALLKILLQTEIAQIYEDNKESV
jgi:DNA (cytosine-5)-methyltransferase 1